MSNSKTKVLSAQDTFSKNIVKAIRAKKIEFKDVISLVKKEGKGERFASVQDLPGVVVDMIKITTKAGNIQKRCSMTVSFAGKKKGDVKKTLITGKFAREAYAALIKVPKVRKVEIPKEDLELANKAFGF